MIEKIVQTELGITIIGAGRVRSKQISKAVRLAPYVLAADGGLDQALESGLIPDAVIGDLDGVSASMSGVPADRLHRVSEQTSTDFEKCLYSVSTPLVIALGVTGSRFDHSLAAMNALAKYPDLPIIVVSGKDLIFLCPLDLRLSLPIGTRLSLFPLAPVSGRQVGLEYPIRDLAFSPVGRIGTSNRTKLPDIHLRFDAPHMLVILPWRHLKVVTRALSRPRG